MQENVKIKQVGNIYDVIIPTGENETIECKIRVDFNTLKKAFKKLTKVDKDGNIDSDPISAGEQILMFGTWVSGDERIKTEPMLKMSACIALAGVVADSPMAQLKKN